ncbi:hypothetical protein BGX38DRAFT_1274939 [Terfezia claveryi]|nr:hypothetical protein BGX38DRAFT_1274939 [Terfezia claveryi]
MRLTLIFKCLSMLGMLSVINAATIPSPSGTPEEPDGTRVTRGMEIHQEAPM